MSAKLTPRQKEIFTYIVAMIDQKGYPPTLRQIGERFGIRSSNGVRTHLKALEKKGFLQREARTSRGIKVVTSSTLPREKPSKPSSARWKPVPPSDSRSMEQKEPSSLEQSFSPVSPEIIEVPVVGRVVAGHPLLAVENVERTLALDQSLVGKAEGCFALRVQGDSMIEDGILEGDYVLVRPQPIANNGDIVVALLGEEATVKRFYREQGRIRLQPANAGMQPIFTREIQILGKVVALVRTDI